MTQIRCEVQGVYVAVSESATVPVVILTDGSDRRLPIFIGIWEAVSINSAINREVLPRPFTHDLFLDVMERFMISMKFLQIDSIENGVYYAQLSLVSEKHDEYIDCRPSDGIALALRGEVPVFVEESVLASAGQDATTLPALVELSTFLQK
jgi:hypothetical protein